MARVLEIRTYRLKPGSGPAFHALVSEASLPLLRAWGVDVVAWGPSLHDPDGYVLMRSYRDLEERQASQDAFYGSEAWRSGPREAIVALIEAYLDAVVPLAGDALDAMRRPAGS